MSKPIIYLAICLGLVIACKNRPGQTENTSHSPVKKDTIKNKITTLTHFLSDVYDSTQNTHSILTKYIPYVLAQSNKGEKGVYLGDTIPQDKRQLFVGKLLDSTNIVAFETINYDYDSATIVFYQLFGITWKAIFTCKAENNPFWVEFVDMDNDGINEIITRSPRNMNGNTFNQVYYYSPQIQRLHFAGRFSTCFEISKDKKQVYEEYRGSWYMDNTKTVYEWHGKMLIPIEQIVLDFNESQEYPKTIFKYYANPSKTIGGLKLQYHKPYTDNNKQLKMRWESFFDHPIECN